MSHSAGDANAPIDVEKSDNPPSNLGSQTNYTPTQMTTSSEAGEGEKSITKDSDELNSEEAMPTDIEYPTGARLVLIVAALLMCVFVLSLDQTIVGTAIPKITDEFKGLDKVSWYGTAYFMTSGGFQPSWGKMPKYFSLKAGFLTALFIFEIGSLICGVAPSATALIVGRAIAGFGAAGLTTCAMTIVVLSSRPEKVPTFMGIMGVAYNIGAISGPLIGGAFTNGVSWRWCFYINLPVGGVAALVILLFFHNPSQAKPTNAPLMEKILNMDLGGAVIMMGAIVSLTLALEYGGQSMSWNSSTVIGLLVGFVLIIGAFIAWQFWQGDRAMLPPTVVKHHPTWSTSVFQFFFAGSYFVALYYLPIYFQSIHNVSPLQSGVRNLPLVLASALAIVSAGQIVTKTQRPAPIMVFSSALAVVACGLFYTFDEGTSMGKWIGYQILGGFAWGGGFQMAINTAQAKADPAHLPTVISTNFFFQTFGGAFSLSAAQSAFANTLTKSLATTAPGVDPAKVVLTGSTEIRTAFLPDQVHGIVLAYMSGLRVVFAFLVGFVGIAFFLSLTQSWARLHGETKPRSNEEA